MKTTDLVLERARTAVGRGILYWIGQGGGDPAAALPANAIQVAAAWASLGPEDQAALAPLAQAMGIDVHDPALVRQACDCSGYVCWALGLARHAAGAEWINTDSIWADATGAQQRFQRLLRARPGALVVYPQKGSFEHFGHVGIVIETDAKGRATRVAHCSADNVRVAPHDAIQITAPDKFAQQPLSIYAWYRGVSDPAGP